MAKSYTVLADFGVKRWLTFKELQEFKPLPFIFPILAAKEGMTADVMYIYSRNILILRNTLIIKIWFYGSNGHESGWSEVSGDGQEVQYVS